ncbi:MAG: hypothetical protein H7Y03_05065 [Chitinophagaceae bacterium]|nr:hypothetical protein [Chitinophagaceae bacterium]
MKKVKIRLLILLIVTGGFIVGAIRGEEARQKWVFKIKSKYETRKLLAEKKSLVRKGGVVLDDIEIAAYHN